MRMGAGLYMYDVVAKKFTFAISSPDAFLVGNWKRRQPLQFLKEMLQVLPHLPDDACTHWRTCYHGATGHRSTPLQL